MSENGNSNDNDQMILLLVGVPLLVIMGPGLLAKFVPAAQNALVQSHVLSTSNLLIHITPTAGLDLGRCAIAIGLVLLAIVGIVLYIRAKTRAPRR